MPRKRIDPQAPARNEYGRYDTTLLNTDPDRYYVFANPNDPLHGVDAYLDQYEDARVENIVEGGPRLASRPSQREGVIKYMGMVLVSFPKALKDDEVKEGQDLTDLNVKRIRGGSLDNDARGYFHKVENREYVER